MTNHPYSRFTPEQLILRDYLAIDRTILANERTLLGYVRTALTLFVAGVSFIKIFNDLITTVIGWVFIPSGIGALVLGWVRYRKMKRIISQINDSKFEVRFEDDAGQTTQDHNV